MKKVINDFVPMGGKHCITNALKQIFHYYGYPMSEAMMFGVASGLSFLYLNQANAPMVNGRIKVFDFEKKLAKRLNIDITCHSSASYITASKMAKQMIDQEEPVLVYVDMPYLNYLHMDPNSHFGGHAVVLFGYDDEREIFWVSDRDQHDAPIRTPLGESGEDYHLVGYAELEKARSSKHPPFPAGNKYLSFDFDGYRKVDKDILKEAIQETCVMMLNPPAQLLGLNGILKFSKEILKWKKFDEKKLRQSAATNYFQINQDGGTGGGIFRKLYGEFLKEASSILDDERFFMMAENFIKIASVWDEIGDELWELSLDGSCEHLPHMSAKIKDLYAMEKQAYEELKQLIAVI